MSYKYILCLVVSLLLNNLPAYACNNPVRYTAMYSIEDSLERHFVPKIHYTCIDCLYWVSYAPRSEVDYTYHFLGKFAEISDQIKLISSERLRNSLMQEAKKHLVRASFLDKRVESFLEIEENEIRIFEVKNLMTTLLWEERNKTFLGQGLNFISKLWSRPYNNCTEDY